MKRIPELDGLRGIAALAVVVYHLDNRWLPWGWAAVDLFFVLSGYLITGIILRGGGGKGGEAGFLKTFHVRRGLRIWPIYYLTIAALAWTAPVGSLGYFLTYAQQCPLYLHPGSPRATFAPHWPVMIHTWTLAVEEQFYLLWPVAVILAGRGRVVALSLAVLAGSIAARGMGYSEYLLIARCDGLALGSLLAGLRAGRRRDHGGQVLVVGSLLWMATASFLPHHQSRGAPAAVILGILAPSLASYGLVARVTREGGSPARPSFRPLACRPLVYLGTISYGFYLYHFPIIVAQGWLRAHAPGYWRLPELPMVVATTIAVATLSWYCVERPILGLKGRLAAYNPDRS